jgi:ferritin-like metal-binding protein YciE
MTNSNPFQDFADDDPAGSSSVGYAPAPLPGLAHAPTEPTPQGAFEKHWLHTLAHVLTNEMQELLSMELQLRDILPQMALAVEDPILRAVCQIHSEQTVEQLRRLERAQEILKLLPDGRTCEGMAALLQGLRENITENQPGLTRDLGLVEAARKIKQFELTSYSNARDFAQLLGMGAVMNLLQTTLNEEIKMAARFGAAHEMLCAYLGSPEFR